MSITLIRDEAAARGELGPAAWAMLLGVFKSELRRFPGPVSYTHLTLPTTSRV
ncbi:hypothetical protein [uncultured Microbacterium sp.]|uniref:hypothetical protein n=1 Tax=uncultured Microbacterium sp. TaxID=191216 RepID=UPI0025CFC0AB|nr:hypothetical protein [uncultured Microbacterium sp.]